MNAPATAASPRALALVEALGLEPHPEGGWFRRTWTAPARVNTANGERATASAILFLLDEDMEAAWHVVRSDELWLWHGPGRLEIDLGGTGDAPADPRRVVLASPDSPSGIDEGGAGALRTGATDASNPVQLLVPAGVWQRTVARGGPALATCVVSPEFSYEDWELAENNA